MFRIDTKETPETIMQYLQKAPSEIPILLDRQGKVGRLFGLWAHPTTYVIDHKGMVRCRSVGYVEWTSSDAQMTLEQLLEEK